MLVRKFGLVVIILLFVLSTVGCFNQKCDQRNAGYNILNNKANTAIVANLDLSGAEIVLNGIVDKQDIVISENLLNMIKYRDEKTVVSIAGDIKSGSRIVEVLLNTSVMTVETISEIREAKVVKRAGESLLGDFDNSGTVDLLDFQVFAQSYGTFKSQHDIAPASLGTGEWLNMYCVSTPDKVVDLNDFIVFAKNYGKKVPVVIINSWPNSANTGIPSDTPALTVISTSMHTTKADQIIDAIDLKGRLYVDHPNVVIKRSRLAGDAYYAVYCTTSGTSLTIEDCDITNGVKMGNGFIGRRNHLHSPENGKMDDGWSVDVSNVLLEENLIDGLIGGVGAHVDGIQVLKGDNIIIRHNWIEAVSPPISGGQVNAAIMIDPDTGEITNIMIDGNMMIEKDGYFPLRLDSRGKVEITRNRFRKGHLGAASRLSSTVVTKWEDNGYDDGEIIVSPAPVKLVESIKVSTDKLNNTLEVGQTLMGSVVVTYNDKSTSNTGNIVWLSDNTKIATIVPTSGKLTAISEGTVIIRALDGGKVGEISVTVTKKTI